MKHKDYQEWEANKRIPFKGITADRLRSYGVPDSEIKTMTFAQADEIVTSMLMIEAETTTKPKKYICRYCHAPVYKSDVVVFDETIICRKCAFGIHKE